MTVLRHLILLSLSFISGQSLSSELVGVEPRLTIDSHEICDGLLERVISTHYESTKNHFGEKGYPEFLTKVAPYSAKSYDVDGQSIAVGQHTNPGCGGACETYSLHAANINATEPTVNSTWGTSEGTIFTRSSSGEYFAASETAKYLRLEKLTSNAEWQTACHIEFYPEKFELIEGPSKSLIKVLADLKKHGT